MDVSIGYPVIRLIEKAGGYVKPYGEIAGDPSPVNMEMKRTRSLNP